MSEELKPCPFCGAKAEKVRGFNQYSCSNPECPLAAVVASQKEWDTRVVDPRITELEAQVAAMREALEAFIGKKPKEAKDSVIYSLPNPRAISLGIKALSLTPLSNKSETK